MDEMVVLLDERANPVGTARKSDVHTASTPLHLAFSCYLYDREGRLLLTRRALTKKTWPGVWTNSFCGHPSPEEAMESAITRRAEAELGVRINHLEVILPSFRYRATDASGVVENEVCPVYRAVIDGEISARPDEVVEHAWVRPGDLLAAITATPFVFSPWIREQLAQSGAMLAR